MVGLLRSVPSELWSTLAVKKTVKQVWDAVKALWIGDERACDASAQQLRQEFGAISFQEGETVNEFASASPRSPPTSDLSATTSPTPR